MGTDYALFPGDCPKIARNTSDVIIEGCALRKTQGNTQREPTRAQHNRRDTVQSPKSGGEHDWIDQCPRRAQTRSLVKELVNE
jgi:hypothetical protein